jgi:pimeloyl-ACP methyl ester carboxylesterase
MQLIFIHCSGGCRESWRYQTEYFKGSEAINLPGHPEGDLRPTIEEYAAWLHAHIHEKDYRDIVLVGHSMGGGIALQYALDYPGELTGLITLGSGARLRVHPKFLTALEKAVANPSGWKGEPAATYQRVEPSLAKEIIRRGIENTPAAFLNDMRACDRFDVMDRLADISSPFLAIVGDQDIMTPPKYSYYMVDKIPNARAVTIPDGTHLVFAEKPDQVNRAIDEFLLVL